ncbi:MAG TPA: DUF3048 domain-containing protein, partial [Actinomycetes bacterium]|nr:DUF3048 domain-containing protein [Actinomycetes bacterium]
RVPPSRFPGDDGRSSRPIASAGRRRRRALVVIAVVLVLAVVGGFGYWALTGSPDRSTTPAPPTAPTTPPADGAVSMDGRAPLTGVPTDADLNHPAVTIKVSNTPDAHPQRGLDSADIVFVEPITGATTRMAAIFHSKLPEEVGPVRSLRPTDAPLTGPTRGVVGNTMAAHWVLDYFDRVTDVDDLGTLRVPRGVYRLDPTRRAPNHVFAHPDRLLALSDRTAPPAPYFSYAPTLDRSTAQQDGQPARKVTVEYGGSATAAWTFDRRIDRWRRAEGGAPDRLENGRQISADNVIVLHTRRDHSFARAGSAMLIPDLIDTSGTLELFTGNKVVEGRWRKAGVNEPFEFTTTDGEPLLLVPGRTWVEIPLEDMSVRIR